MESPVPADPVSLLHRLHAAQNQHNIEAFVDCFAPDYQSEQPLHPDVAFRGRDQVYKNWSTIFKGVPDFQSELLSFTAQGNTVWVEWHWHGTRTDGKQLNIRGVTLFGIEDNHIAWGRLYMEPVQEAGAGIDMQVRSRVQE